MIRLPQRLRSRKDKMKPTRIAIPAALLLASLLVSTAGCGKAPLKAAVSTTPSASTTAAASNIPFEVVSISDAHPGDDVTVTIKTGPGAEAKIVFTMPSGSVSGYPKDNVKTAGADGLVTWTWNINSHVGAGEASYAFTITLNGETRTETVKKNI